MEAKFIVEKGNMAEGWAVDINNVTFENPIPIFEEFDHTKKICDGFIYKENGSLICEANIPSNYLNFYPAVGVQTGKPQKLFSIGLSVNRNQDKTILTISEQATGEELKLTE